MTIISTMETMLIVILLVFIVVLLLPLIFWTVRFLWWVSISYLKFGLSIYIEIFKELGPILGTLIGMFLMSIYIIFPGAAIYLLSPEVWEILRSGLHVVVGKFASFRVFWQFSIICVLVFIVKEYCKLMYRVNFKNSY